MKLFSRIAGLLSLLAWVVPAHTAPSALAPADLVEALKGKTLAQIVNLNAKLPKDQQSQLSSAIVVDTRIVGGKVKSISDFPWQVALIRGYVSEPARSQFCGGALIAPDVVLTAAHCVDNSVVRKNATRIDVVLGTAVYDTGGERIHVQGVFVHPQWNATTNDYDFALLKLSAPSALGSPTTLSSQIVTDGVDADVSGWGALSEGGPGSRVLLAATLPVVSTAECNTKDSYNSDITPQMLCAGKREGGVDSCQGDSGGPLVLHDTRQLIGIVSFGEGCARALKYGVYARLSSAIPWIQSFSQPAVKIAAAHGERLPPTSLALRDEFIKRSNISDGRP